MAFYGNAHVVFEAVANELIANKVDDATKHDVLAALMDHVGVPMVSVQQYRQDPAIVALFAERGVRLLPDANT